MDIYQSAIDYVLTLPIIQSWPELQELFTSKALRKPKYWQLPMQACQAVGGSVEQALPAIVSMGCAQIGIILLDDMLDDDPRGEYHRAGYGRAANYASAFQAAAFESFCSNDVLPEIRLPGLGSLNRMILTTALGQHLDVQNPPDEAAYWHVVKNKSAPFFGAAFCMGALAGGASYTIANELEQFGRLYGEMIQIHDDLTDVMAVPANSDWIQGRSPLPILFAKLVDHPERARFLELCQEITQPQALAEAQDILLRCGAISYCVDQLLRRHQTVQDVLNTIPLARREFLDALIKDVVAPVYRLFEETGSQPAMAIPTLWEEIAQ